MTDLRFWYIFQRLREPAYIPKGEARIRFEVPIEYLPDDMKAIGPRLMERYRNLAKHSIPVQSIPIPDLGEALTLGRHESFVMVNSAHRQMSANLSLIFMKIETVDELLSLFVYCRDRLNPKLFVVTATVVMKVRDFTKNIPIPSLIEVLPDSFINSEIIHIAREQAYLFDPADRKILHLPFQFKYSSDNPGQELSYWREDVGISHHHAHWHMIYPFDGPESAVRKDRRGELFLYMHHQIMTRYQTELLSNGLPRVQPLQLREPIEEAYFSKLRSTLTSRSLASRPKGLKLSDINRPGDNLVYTINQLELYQKRIFEAIRARQILLTDGTFQKMNDFDGVDILGNMLESSILSPNHSYYGNLHNFVHFAIAFAHDPDGSQLEIAGPVAEGMYAPRDPLFYRIHAWIDTFFYGFKDSILPYTTELEFPGISVTDVKVVTLKNKPNIIETHWCQSDIEVSAVLHFAPPGESRVRVTHLNHNEFEYKIQVENQLDQSKFGTVRIFMAPQFDENGKSMAFDEQRKLMIEMDKFEHLLAPGTNIIRRSSTMSAITVPFESTFRDLDASLPWESSQSFTDYEICGCGWPQHLLVPRGNESGYPMVLFVMVSNSDSDRVNHRDSGSCKYGISYCGLRDRKYPDARSMGYPFDRRAVTAETMLDEFLTQNMKTAQIVIKFSDIVKPRQACTESVQFTERPTLIDLREKSVTAETFV